MPQPTVYLNGEYLPRDQAHLSVEDRGTLFGDGVYEVVRYYQGRPLAMGPHLQRLRRSLEGLRLPEPAGAADLPTIGNELLRRNGLSEAKVYWQITRGPAPREHRFPDNPCPTLLAMAYPAPPLDAAGHPTPSPAVLVEDTRWSHCWIKSLMLLPNVLARQEAARQGGREAILHRAGIITEAGAANVFVLLGGQLRTHPANQRILDGVTRRQVLDLARDEGLPIRTEAVTVDQLREADEVFFTSTTAPLAPCPHVNGRPVADGAVGPVTTRLHRAFLQKIVLRNARD